MRNLDTAFQNFFDKRAEYPAFKRKHDGQSVRYASNAFTFIDGKLSLAKQDAPLDIVWSRKLPKDGHVTSVTVSRDKAGRYFVSILVETEVKPLKKCKAQVGIDVGLANLAICSDGEKLPNPRFLQAKERRVKIRSDE